MTAAGRWFATPHAVERYQQITPGRTYEAALADLIRESEGARVVRVLDSGALLCRGPRPRRLRYVVRAPAEPGALPVLVTVLPTHDAIGRKSTTTGIDTVADRR